MNTIRYQIPTFTPTIFSPRARFSTLENEIDRLFDVPFFGRRNTDAAVWTPALDLHQDKENLYVHAEVPGMRKEDIALSLHEGVLTLTGERKAEGMQEGRTQLRNERFSGRFERSITLPTPVDVTKVAATYENGVLTVTLPKAEAVKPRQIEISVK